MPQNPDLSLAGVEPSKTMDAFRQDMVSRRASCHRSIKFVVAYTDPLSPLHSAKTRVLQAVPANLEKLHGLDFDMGMRFTDSFGDSDVIMGDEGAPPMEKMQDKDFFNCTCALLPSIAFLSHSLRAPR